MNILEEIKKETKKIIITIALLLVMFPAAWSISVLLHASSREILSMLFLVYLFFIAQLWFYKDMDVAKTVNKARIAFLTTVTFILLRLIAARLFDLPPLMSVQYYLYLHRKLAVSSTAILQKMLMTYAFDIGLALLVLYYFTYKTGEILKKLTWYTGLTLVIAVAVIATLQRVFPASTATMWNQISQTDFLLNAFLRSRGYLGAISVLGFAFIILGIALPKKWGESLIEIGALVLIVCFGIFCCNTVPKLLTNKISSSKSKIQLSREIINGKEVTHTFYPGLDSLKSTLLQDFEIRKIDISGVVAQYIPRSERIRTDLPYDTILFSREFDLYTPSKWFSLEEAQQKGYCKGGKDLFVSINYLRKGSNRVKGKAIIKYKLI
ncbi:hypothetical protein D4R87_02725 [bacterium]|nr:MAG: hypothetical protein D4R87_02725 [bacterium]